MVSACCTLGVMVAHSPDRTTEQMRCAEKMQNKPAPYSVIDFNRSHLVWTTKAGSRGFWRLIASASLISSTHQTLDQFVLAPAVMAGDVYGGGRLLKEPPYSFQIFASRQRHTIVREPGISIGSAVNADSTANNQSVFAELAIHIAETNRNAIDLDRLGDGTVSPSWPLMANVELCGPNGDGWVLNFPVNHINVAAIDGKNAFSRNKTNPYSTFAHISGVASVSHRRFRNWIRLFSTSPTALISHYGDLARSTTPPAGNFVITNDWRRR